MKATVSSPLSQKLAVFRYHQQDEFYCCLILYEGGRWGGGLIACPEKSGNIPEQQRVPKGPSHFCSSHHACHYVPKPTEWVHAAVMRCEVWGTGKEDAKQLCGFETWSLTQRKESRNQTAKHPGSDWETETTSLFVLPAELKR